MAMSPETALDLAIAKCGGEANLARALGITPQAVNQWNIAPATRCIAIEQACNSAVTREQLRPDLYPEVHGQGDGAGQSSLHGESPAAIPADSEAAE